MTTTTAPPSQPTRTTRLRDRARRGTRPAGRVVPEHERELREELVASALLLLALLAVVGLVGGTVGILWLLG